jgi:hypothetical protein
MRLAVFFFVLDFGAHVPAHSEETRRKEALKSRQIAERLGVEEAHMLEFQQFTALYA